MLEIERKWLLNKNIIPIKYLTSNSSYYEELEIGQYYLEIGELEEKRVKEVYNKTKQEVRFYHTTKTLINGHDNQLVRDEKEYEITEFNFEQKKRNRYASIFKTVKKFKINDVFYEISFYRDLDLILLEIEFDTIELANAFEPLCWFGEEVTTNKKYKNANLAFYGLSEENLIKEIVLTGGPCGGKSTVLAELKRVLTEKGWKVLISSEVATSIMEGGSKPWEVTPYTYQTAVVENMISNQKKMNILAEGYKQQGQNVVIFYDRGLLDNIAYCDRKTYEVILNEYDLSIEEVHHMYNAVFCIESTAYGAEEIYLKQLSNNPTRYENTIELGREAEDKTKDAWNGHHNLIVFHNNQTWREKEQSIFVETYKILGMQPFIKSDNKFLVNVPDLEFQKKLEKEFVSQIITQTYLKSDELSEKRIRMIKTPKYKSYYYTEKEWNGKEQIIREKIINKEEYQGLLKQKCPLRNSIIKTRIPFIYNQKYYVLDIFPKEILEKSIIETRGVIPSAQLYNDIKELKLMGFTNIIDITENESYSNYNIALRNED